MHNLTMAQQRALSFLTSEWKKPGRLSAACSSLRNYHPSLVEEEWLVGPRGGRSLQYRLTIAGEEFKGRSFNA